VKLAGELSLKIEERLALGLVLQGTDGGVDCVASFK